MSKKIEQILEKDEKILWQGGISRALLGFEIFILFLFLILLVYWQISWSFVLILLFAAVIYFAYQLIKEFFLTNKRLVLKSGLIGTDFKSVYFNEIKSIDLRVDLIDKIFSIGTINVNIGLASSGGKAINSSHLSIIKLNHLDDCYLAYQKMQEISSDYKERLYAGKKIV